jgi:hypothetical protein
MSRGPDGVRLDWREVLQALERAMERAVEVIDLDLWFRLRDARDEVARCFCHGVLAKEIFQPWEPEYQQAGRVASVELPAAVEAGARLLQSIAGGAP